MNIKELAEQAGIKSPDLWKLTIGPTAIFQLEKFAELVAAHALMNIDPSKFIGGYQEGFESGVAKEREECAKVCDEVYESRGDADECATEIRGRSKA